jgi:hypothetical protein
MASKTKKPVFFYLLFFITICFLLIFSFPYLVSTPWGTKILCKTIAMKTKSTLKIGNMHLTWFGPQYLEKVQFSSERIDLSFERFTTDISLPSLFHLPKIQAKTLFSLKTENTLKDGNFSIRIPAYPEAKFFHVNGQIKTSFQNEPIEIYLSGNASENNSEGPFSLQGSIKSLEGKKKRFEDFLIDMKVDGKEIPTIFLDQFLSSRLAKFSLLGSPLLGEKLSLTGTSSFSHGEGNIQIDISSTNVKAFFDGHLSNETLTLNAPFKGSIILSEQMNEMIVKSLHPLRIDSFKAKNPISFQMESENFSLPYKTLELAKIHITKGMIDLGQMEVKNGELASMMSLLKQKWGEGKKKMNVWCTPLYFSLDNGRIFLQRIDALIGDSIHICSWGSIDLIQDRVDMVLGLTADALYNAFGISDLSKEYVLQIPMRGSLQKVKIDTSQATKKIAALLAQKSLKKRAPIIGEILGAVQGKEDQSHVPPPTSPIPWEGKVKKHKEKKASPLEKFPLDIF